MKNKYKINLFMFAEPNMNLNKTTAATTPNANSGRRDYDDLTPQMRAYYVADLLDLATPRLVYSQFAVKQPIPANNGKSIEWHGYADLEELPEALTEGVTPSGLHLKQYDITGHVQQYGAYISFTDMLLMTGADKNISEANKKLAAQMSLLYDKIDRDTLLGGTHKIFAGTREDGSRKVDRSEIKKGDLFTVDLIYDAVNELQRVNAPTINGAYACVLHPDVARDLMRSEDWKDINKYSRPERFDAGYIGEIDNCRFYISTNAKIYGADDETTGDVAVYSCVFLGDGAFGTTEISGGGLETIVKQLGSGGTADPLNQRSSVGVKGTKGSVILINDYIVQVECTSTRGDITRESN